MEQIVSEIVTALMFAGLIIAMFFGFKYWIDNGGVDKMTEKINNDLVERNSKLRKEVRAQKQLIKNYQILLENKEHKIAELLEEEEQSEKEECDNAQQDD